VHLVHFHTILGRHILDLNTDGEGLKSRLRGSSLHINRCVVAVPRSCGSATQRTAADDEWTHQQQQHPAYSPTSTYTHTHTHVHTRTVIDSQTQCTDWINYAILSVCLSVCHTSSTTHWLILLRFIIVTLNTNPTVILWSCSSQPQSPGTLRRKLYQKRRNNTKKQ